MHQTVTFVRQNCDSLRTRLHVQSTGAQEFEGSTWAELNLIFLINKTEMNKTEYMETNCDDGPIT